MPGSGRRASRGAAALGTSTPARRNGVTGPPAMLPARLAFSAPCPRPGPAARVPPAAAARRKRLGQVAVHPGGRPATTASGMASPVRAMIGTRAAGPASARIATRRLEAVHAGLQRHAEDGDEVLPGIGPRPAAAAHGQRHGAEAPQQLQQRQPADHQQHDAVGGRPILPHVPAEGSADGQQQGSGKRGDRRDPRRQAGIERGNLAGEQPGQAAGEDAGRRRRRPGEAPPQTSPKARTSRALAKSTASSFGAMPRRPISSMAAVRTSWPAAHQRSAGSARSRRVAPAPAAERRARGRA